MKNVKQKILLMAKQQMRISKRKTFCLQQKKRSLRDSAKMLIKANGGDALPLSYLKRLSLSKSLNRLVLSCLGSICCSTITRLINDEDECYLIACKQFNNLLNCSVD